MAKAKVVHSDDAITILVEGNKHKSPEPGHNIIMFPGGSISVVRCTDDTYYAHIEVNHGSVAEYSHRKKKRGDVINSRVDYDFPGNLDEPHIVPIENQEKINHIAIRIKTS